MKKLFLLTKTLLAVALLCVGQNAWGQVSTWTYSSTLASNTFGAEFDGSRTGVVKVQLGTSSEASSWKIFNTNSKNRGVCSGTNTRTFDPTNTAIPVTGTFMMVKPTKDVYFTVTVFNGGTKQQIKYADLATPTQSTTLNDGYNINANTEKEITVGKLLAGHTYYIYQSGTTDFAFKSFSATTYEDCTINYKYEGTLIKSEVLNNYIGQSVTATLASMWNDGEDAKYFVADNATTSFTVAESGNNFDVALREAETWSYTVRAVDGSSNVLNANVASGSVTEGESAYIAYSQYILKNNTLYNIASEKYISGDWFHANITPDEDDYVFDLVYSNSIVNNVVFYSEAENLSGSAQNSDNVNINGRSSGGRVARYGDGKDHSLTTLPAGKYQIYARSFSDGGSGRKVIVKAGDSEVFNWIFPNSNNGTNNSDEFELTASTALTIFIGGTSSAGLDWIYIKKTGEVATIGSYGYATFSSTYPVNVDVEGLEAYIATSSNGSSVTMQKVTGNVAAGIGLVLKGAAGSYTLPVVASGEWYNTESDPKNYLFAVNSNYNLEAAGEGNGTNYVLSVQSGNVVWAPIGATAAPVKAGQAALWIPEGGTNTTRALRMSFGGITEIENVEAAAEATAKKNGAYLENGKIAIYKNGVKYNAAGAKLY